MSQFFLKHAATHCYTLQRTATQTHFKSTLATIKQVAINHIATHCNTLQHTATHCNTHTHYNSALAPIDKIAVSFGRLIWTDLCVHL